MQTSAMMLDPKISKILTTKQEDQPIDSDNKNVADISDSKTNLAEAEVRLVVRLIVEEQIVYKGKVEKVNQLENEELSRVVSRVAWDDRANTGNSTGDIREEIQLEPETSVTAPPHMESPQPTPPSLYQDCHNSDANTDNVSTPEAVDYVSEVKNDNESVEQDEYSDNIKPSNPEICIKLDMIQTNEGISIAQDKTNVATSSSTTTNCDETNLSMSQDHTHEIGKTKIYSNHIQTKVVNEQHLTENFIINTINNHANFGLISHPTPESSNDCDENQSVIDMLNECVDNIDYESRLQHNNPTNVDVPNCNLKLESQMVPTKIVNEGGYISSKVSAEEIVKENSSDADKSLDQANTHGIAQSTQICSLKDSLPEPKTQTKDDTTITSMKRKSANDTIYPDKKVRRTSHKEQRLTTSRKNSKSVENSSSRQNSAPGRDGTTMSLLANGNQQSRQIRVFAKWSDNCFYPGVILKRATADRKFVIGFLDGAQKDIAETDLISLSNIHGKQVRVTIAKNYCYNAIVHDQCPPINDQPVFDVEYQHDGLIRKCVSWKDIFLTGEQGTPLINQAYKNSGASNFADVDLDNIIYDKRSRRIQEMEEFYLTSPSPHRTKTSVLL